MTAVTIQFNGKNILKKKTNELYDQCNRNASFKLGYNFEAK